MVLIMAEESTRRLADIDWKEFDQVFLIALLLTGGVEEAEISMLEGMGAIDRAAGGTTFLYSTIEAAVRQARSPVEEACAGQPSSVPLNRIALPLELRRVLALRPDQRHCFVLRILVGLTVDECSECLRLSKREVAVNVVSAAVSLARIREEKDDCSIRQPTTPSA
jgi:hypothetical protein